jgi:DNA polymerase III subunit epsilon
VVDLELSGLDAKHDEIISFAAVPIDAGRVVVGASVYGICRATQPLTERSILVHGIRSVDLVNAPPLATAIEPLLDAMTGRVMVAHVAWVERTFLSVALRSVGVRLREPILDTNDMGRLLALQRGHEPVGPELGDLARSLSLPVHRPHHALGDALTTAQVFIALATQLDQFTPETVRSLARSGDRTRYYTS